MPVSIGSTRCTGAGPAPFSACVRCALAVLFVIGGSLAPVVGTVCLGRRDSHADQGAVATQFSSSTGAGTSPRGQRESDDAARTSNRTDRSVAPLRADRHGLRQVRVGVM